MKHNFPVVFFSIALCASFASATKNKRAFDDDQEQNSPTGAYTPTRRFDATRGVRAPRRIRHDLNYARPPVPRSLFQEEPVTPTTPTTPEEPVLWEDLAARAAAAATANPHAPAALPEYDPALDEEQILEEDGQEQAEAALRALLARLHVASPCREAARYDYMSP